MKASDRHRVAGKPYAAIAVQHNRHRRIALWRARRILPADAELDRLADVAWAIRRFHLGTIPMPSTSKH